MTVTIRPFTFTDEDYDLAMQISKATFPDTTRSVEGMKYFDKQVPDEAADWMRYFVEWDGVPVGVGVVTLAYDLSAPDQYYVTFSTHPDYRKRGVASAYLEKLENEYFATRPVTAWLSYTRSDQPQSVEFMEKRGYTLQMRNIISAVDLTTVELSGYDRLKAKFDAQGIALFSLDRLMATDPNYLTKLWDLEWILSLDEPHVEPPKRLSIEEFENRYLKSPSFLPEGWFIAKKGDEYVGWSAIFHNTQFEDTMQTGITVIDRAYRRQGLATYMKLAGFKYAIGLGKRQIKTSNEESNPMFALNQRLGFKEVVSELEYKKFFNR